MSVSSARCLFAQTYTCEEDGCIWGWLGEAKETFPRCLTSSPLSVLPKQTVNAALPSVSLSFALSTSNSGSSH